MIADLSLFLNSFAFCALLELVMSGCSTPMPAQNNLWPLPEPVDSIFGTLLPVFLPKVSATTVANG